MKKHLSVDITWNDHKSLCAVLDQVKHIMLLNGDGNWRITDQHATCEFSNVEEIETHHPDEIRHRTDGKTEFIYRSKL